MLCERGGLWGEVQKPITVTRPNLLIVIVTCVSGSDMKLAAQIALRSSRSPDAGELITLTTVA